MAPRGRKQTPLRLHAGELLTFVEGAAQGFKVSERQIIADVATRWIDILPQGTPPPPRLRRQYDWHRKNEIKKLRARIASAISRERARRLAPTFR